ncbi:spore coat protein A [Kitasatospora gansuensis]|uniref:Spore coat protein A n=3 Tax=Kitasatospora TaxID=2063 RepID=A0A7W7S9A9_9ACTN|nr:multicopper oxidase domain-containing protein [Kitasatospora gansuensis]MBB4945847.1 spore coat protein A [Kitasatospora gansuensis]
MPDPTELTKFADPLRIPQVLRPEAELTIRQLSAEVQLHSELPPTPMWTYEGTFPGPTIEVRRGQRLRIDWQNRISTPYPAQIGHLPDITMPPAENSPGIDPALIDPRGPALPPWLVVHLHGAVTNGGNDGWTDNAVHTGHSQLSEYPNDQAAMPLWYHDHAMGVTRLNVLAGLVGTYLVRDEEEDRLHLPAGEFEVPLVLCDRNLATGPDGALTGQLLHKTVGPLPYCGRYTLVNGVIWPHHEVRPRWYRFRVLNASNSRPYRLHLVDQDGQRVHGVAWQIGSDAGLFGTPIPLPGRGLSLAPAERADLLIDFTALAGRTLRLVNSAPAPAEGAPIGEDDAVGIADPANRLPDPEVMEFRVSAAAEPEPFALPAVLSPSFRRLTHDDIPHHNHRVLMITQDTSAMFHFWEMEEVPEAEVPPIGTTVDGIVQVQAAGQAVHTYRRVSADFNDRLNWRIDEDAWEQWTIINLAQLALHPVHIHLIQFQILTRATVDVTGFDPVSGGTPIGKPVGWDAQNPIDPADQGWKDTVTVSPRELVRVAGQFTGATGKFMYHCHILDHEDDGMMRPFTVSPAAVMALDPGMGHGGMHHEH